MEEEWKKKVEHSIWKIAEYLALAEARENRGDSFDKGFDFMAHANMVRDDILGDFIKNTQLPTKE